MKTRNIFALSTRFNFYKYTNNNDSIELHALKQLSKFSTRLSGVLISELDSITTKRNAAPFIFQPCARVRITFPQNLSPRAASTKSQLLCRCPFHSRSLFLPSLCTIFQRHTSAPSLTFLPLNVPLYAVPRPIERSSSSSCNAAKFETNLSSFFPPRSSLLSFKACLFFKGRFLLGGKC